MDLENHKSLSDFWMASLERAENKKNFVSSSNPGFRGKHYQNLGKHENDPNYGCPINGSRTEYRGKKAFIHVMEEILDLCDIIRQIGTELPNGTIAVTFGKLFDFYTRVSEKVVGILVRARKHGIVDFEGEMLYQRQDDHVLIKLIKSPEQIMREIEQAKAELKSHPAHYLKEW